MNDSFDCGYFVVFNRSIYWTGWNILQFNKVELNTQSRKDKLINLSFRLCVLILSNFIELTFTVWNYLIQVEFHSVKFLNSTRSTFDFVEWNWTSWIRIQFHSTKSKDERFEFEFKWIPFNLCIQFEYTGWNERWTGQWDYQIDQNDQNNNKDRSTGQLCCIKLRSIKR